MARHSRPVEYRSVNINSMVELHIHLSELAPLSFSHQHLSHPQNTVISIGVPVAVSYAKWPLPQEFFLSSKMLAGACSGMFMAWIGKLPLFRLPRFALIGAAFGVGHHFWVRPKLPHWASSQDDALEYARSHADLRKRVIEELGLKPTSDDQIVMPGTGEMPNIQDFLRDEERSQSR